MNPLLFTVDVESDWGTDHTRGIAEVLPQLLESLDRHRATATFFVVGQLAASVRAVLPPSTPHEVASHGHTHRILDRLTPAEVDRELLDSKAALEAQGYAVDGFRAPFLRRPREFTGRLAAHGYRYDSSGGSVVPSLRNVGAPSLSPGSGFGQLRPATLRDCVTPFSLTWLRLYSPIGLRLLPRGPAVFYCHLHEFLDGPPGDRGGWQRLPKPLRALHRRHCGPRAWALIDTLLDRAQEVCSCRDWLDRDQPAIPLSR